MASVTEKHSSGLDFADKPPPSDHPDVSIFAEDRGFMQRNKVEQSRLQGLMKSSHSSSSGERRFRKSLFPAWDRWMVNEGGRKLFFFVFILVQGIIAGLGFVNYFFKDNLNNARSSLGITYPIARSAALVLNVLSALILIPVCRNFISLLRRTELNHFVPFDKSLNFHKAVAWSVVFWTVVHVVAHMVNFAKLSASRAMSSNIKSRIVGFLSLNFATGPGITGWIMTLSLFVMVVFSIEKVRRAHYERFWYSHHLFVPFFVAWQLHGMFCMIPTDRPPFCDWNTIGLFWRFWLVGGVIFVFERILREVKSRHRTYISKVIQHPSKVVEIQIKKEKTNSRAGQYIYLCCPEISYFQWHPFTLTSAPEEDYISIHMRVVGDFTKALAKSLGCNFDHDLEFKDKDPDESSAVIPTKLNKVLPRVMIDGPFGSASEDFAKYETVLLIGAGIGVTPFASILKTIWYRMSNFSDARRTRLSKVYFIWVIRDFASAEWFHSLLHALEEQDTQNRIEITIYLTGNIKYDDLNNIIMQDVGAEKDAITSLRAPTHFGRPNWDKVFRSVKDKHSDADIGVFYCGPPAISKTLHAKCNEYTNPEGSRFFYNKENF